MAETMLTGGAIVVVWWLTRAPEPGAPLWTWAAWRLPDPAASYVDLRTVHTRNDALPIRRHDGTWRVWEDQGLSDLVADVAAIRAQRDFTTWRRPVVAGAAAGLALAGAVPVVAHDGARMWTSAAPSGTGWPGPVVESDALPSSLSFRFAELAPADLARFNARFRESLRLPTAILPSGGRDVQVITAAPAPSDVMTLDLIQVRLSAGLSTVVADAMATLLAMA